MKSLYTSGISFFLYKNILEKIVKIIKNSQKIEKIKKFLKKIDFFISF